MLLKHLVQNLGSCSGQQLLHLVVTENDLEFRCDRSKNGESQDWHMKKHRTERLFLEVDAMVVFSLSLITIFYLICLRNSLIDFCLQQTFCFHFGISQCFGVSCQFWPWHSLSIQPRRKPSAVLNIDWEGCMRKTFYTKPRANIRVYSTLRTLPLVIQLNNVACMPICLCSNTLIAPERKKDVTRLIQLFL